MNLMPSILPLAAALAAALPAVSLAQRDVPMRNGIPVAPQGIVIPTLPREPVNYATAENQEIVVSVVTDGLDHPWSLVFLPNNDVLVTERTGQVRLIREGLLQPAPVPGVPAVRSAGLSGLYDIKLHPEFAANQWIYLSYNKPLGDERSGLAVARAQWTGRGFENVTDIFQTEDTGGIARMVFGRDGKLYLSTAGGGGDLAQNPMNLAGKVMRLNDDGSVPTDNPFFGREGYRPEIYTLGHRSPEGLAVHPETGDIWEVEMGPNGGDELNRLKPGGNYGWPLVSLGRTYPGDWQGPFSRGGFEDPEVFWTPSISISGLAFYTGDALPNWTGDVFVGGMRYGEIPGTGQLQRILFNTNMQELRRESLLADLRQRIRDVHQGPDGLLYLLVDADNGALLQIAPGGGTQ